MTKSGYTASVDRTDHASCVIFRDQGIIIRGASGSGKSHLAFRLITEESARLVADDRVILAPVNGRLLATAPAPIRGLLERRGHGLLHMTFEQQAICRIVIDLIEPAHVPRLPDDFHRSTGIQGIELQRVQAGNATDAIAHLKLLVDRSPTPTNISHLEHY